MCKWGSHADLSSDVYILHIFSSYSYISQPLDSNMPSHYSMLACAVHVCLGGRHYIVAISATKAQHGNDVML